MSRSSSAEQLYALVANEEDARLCKDISPAACQEVPGNFLRILVSLILTKIGDLLTSPKVVLPWLLQASGAPAAMIGWLVPIRESGSLIPQLALGAWVRRHPQRAGFWVLGSIGQAICIAAMAATAWSLQGGVAGGTIIGLLVLFSLCRGLCSVSMKDVQGKCIPKSRRGRLGGLAGTVAGLLVALIGAVLFGDFLSPGPLFYMSLLMAAAVLWLLAAATFHGVREFDGESGGGRHLFEDMRGSLLLLRKDPEFLHFIVTRALLMCSALSAPFFVVLAQQSETSLRLLGGFLFASSLASAFSATIWGWMADDSSRRVMMRGGAMAAVACLSAFACHLAFTGTSREGIALVCSYFVLAIAHAGVRIGRKTYLVDMAGGNKRTDYVAVSNTAIGFLLLAVGGLTSLLALVSTPAVLLVLGLMGLAGSFSAARLREV